MENTFLPLIFRMKYINRWALMFNTQTESVMQHTAECAFIVHYLAIIGNQYYEKNYDINKLTVCALFHDASEVLTGDLPTPIKYFNDDIKTIYKQIEQAASEKIIKHLPRDLQKSYAAYFDESNLNSEERKLIKISDKLYAYIKCIQEVNAGNKEFMAAYTEIRKDIESIKSEELKYFLDNCLVAFSLSLDDLKATLN